MQARDLGRRSRRIRAAARGASRCSRASRARRRRTPATSAPPSAPGRRASGSCVSATTAQRSSSFIASTVSSGIVRTSVHAGDVPRLGVLVARIADRHLVVEADGDLRQVFRQLRRADHEHPVARAVDRRQHLAVEREAVGRRAPDAASRGRSRGRGGARRGGRPRSRAAARACRTRASAARARAGSCRRTAGRSGAPRRRTRRR